MHDDDDDDDGERERASYTIQAVSSISTSI